MPVMAGAGALLSAIAAWAAAVSAADIARDVKLFPHPRIGAPSLTRSSRKPPAEVGDPPLTRASGARSNSAAGLGYGVKVYAPTSQERHSQHRADW